MQVDRPDVVSGTGRGREGHVAQMQWLPEFWRTPKWRVEGRGEGPGSTVHNPLQGATGGNAKMLVTLVRSAWALGSRQGPITKACGQW